MANQTTVFKFTQAFERETYLLLRMRRGFPFRSSWNALVFRESV